MTLRVWIDGSLSIEGPTGEMETLSKAAASMVLEIIAERDSARATARELNARLLEAHTVASKLAAFEHSLGCPSAKDCLCISWLREKAASLSATIATRLYTEEPP